MEPLHVNLLKAAPNKCVKGSTLIHYFLILFVFHDFLMEMLDDISSAYTIHYNLKHKSFTRACLSCRCFPMCKGNCVLRDLTLPLLLILIAEMSFLLQPCIFTRGNHFCFVKNCISYLLLHSLKLECEFSSSNKSCVLQMKRLCHCTQLQKIGFLRLSLSTDCKTVKHRLLYHTNLPLTNLSYFMKQNSILRKCWTPHQIYVPVSKLAIFTHIYVYFITLWVT